MITPEMAKAELARRRSQSSQSDEEEIQVESPGLDFGEILKKSGKGLERGFYEAATGVGELAQSLGNLPAKGLSKWGVPLSQSEVNFEEFFGTQNPSGAGQFIRELFKEAPAYSVGGSTRAGANMLSKALGRIGEMGLRSGGSEFAQSVDPEKAAKRGLTGALFQGGIESVFPVAKLAALTLGEKATQNQLMNKIMEYLSKRSAKPMTKTKSPEETAMQINEEYLTPEGKIMSADIGKITSDPYLEGIYSSLGMVPRSGVSGQREALEKQIIDKEGRNIENLEAKIGERGKEAADTESRIASKENILMTEAQKNIQDLIEKERGASAKLEKESGVYGELEDELNRLPRALLEGKSFKNINAGIVHDLKALKDQNMLKARELYQPLNDSNLRFDLNPKADFPNYRDAAYTLAADAENFKNIFSPGSLLGQKTGKEVAAALKFLENKDVYAVSLPDLISQMQNLGELTASLKSAGKYNESRIMGNLATGLKRDVEKSLENMGQKELSEQLKNANEYYSKNVIPFRASAPLKNAVYSKKMPTGATLAKALLTPSDQSVFALYGQLPERTQNAAFFKVLTQGKEGASGKSTMTGQQIQKAYDNLIAETKGQTQKTPLAKSVEKLPAAEQRMKALKEEIDQYKSEKTDIEKGLDRNIKTATSQEKEQLKNIKKEIDEFKKSLTKQQTKSSGRIQKAKEMNKSMPLMRAIRNIGYGYGALSPVLKSGLLLGGLKSAGIAVPTILTARRLSKILTNPELIKKYSKGERFEELNSPTDLFFNMLSKALAVETKDKDEQ